MTYAGSRESLAPVQDDIRLVEGDVADADLVSKLVAEADAVVHFAAETHDDNSLADPEPFLHTNVDRHLHGAGGRAPASVSGCTTYRPTRCTAIWRWTTRSGSPSPRRTTRRARTRRPRPAADMLVRAWVRSYGVRATISNCSNNYGPYQHVEKFIPRQITNVLTGRRPKLYGSGANVRDWIHVDDHNSAVWRILADGRIGRTYLIGAEGERDNLSVMRTILKLMGHDPE